jgi:hypothetical protein
MSATTLVTNEALSIIFNLEINLIIADRNVIAYLAQFGDEETQCEKAIEALKVGVIAIQSASPTLDTQVVQAKFAEVERRVQEQLTEFTGNVAENLRRYFAEQEGVVPRSIDGIFGDSGSLARTFKNFFDPADGRLSNLIQAQIGPQSSFGKALDPQNKQGVLALIEARVHDQVEKKLDEVRQEFSLDEEGSAMSKMNRMLTEFFGQLNQSLGIKTGAAAEACKGHVKGMNFEKDLYDVFAALGRSLGDETELVRGLAGLISRCKKGDFVAILGETSGSPGTKIVVEVKDTPTKLKDAIDESQEAKKNRGAACGIFVFAGGCEPAEVGDFRRIGEDFYVTACKQDLEDGKPLMFFESAYKIARALAVAAARKEIAGQLDIQKIQDHIDALANWSDRIADMATKAKTIQSSGKIVEQCAMDLRADLEARVTAILKLLSNVASDQKF